MTNYNLIFKNENIFDVTYPYKINCIGKQTSKSQTSDAITIYYFVSHENKYQVTEFVSNNNFEIIVEQIENFKFKKGFNNFLFVDEIQESVMKEMANQYKHLAYHKDGFYIFTEIVEKSGKPYIGGIVDIYNFKSCTEEEFQMEYLTAK